MATIIQLRRGVSTEWQTANPLLALAEMGLELDTDQFKIGDGVNRWNSLPYGGIQGPQGVQGPSGYSNLTIQKTANVALMKLDLVTLTSTGVKLADNSTTKDDATVLGIAINDANPGQQVNVIRSGIINDPALAVFARNSLVFLDTDGGFTDLKPTVPSAKFLTIIGQSLGDGDFIVNIQNTLYL